MSIAIWLNWISNKDKNSVKIYFVHIFFNGMWSIVFFGFHQILLALLNLLTSHGVLLRKVYFQWSNQAQTFQDNHNLNVCIGHTSIDGVTRCSPEQSNIEPFYDSLIGSCKIITIDSAREYSPDTLIRGPFTLENQPNALHNLEAVSYTHLTLPTKA